MATTKEKLDSNNYHIWGENIGTCGMTYTRLDHHLSVGRYL